MTGRVFAKHLPHVCSQQRSATEPDVSLPFAEQIAVAPKPFSEGARFGRPKKG